MRELPSSPPAAASGQAAVQEVQPQMSRESRAMLLNVLWHHQGGSSPVGQPLRKLLGIEQHAHLTDEQLSEAKWIDGLLSRAAASQPSAQTDDALEVLRQIESAARGLLNAASTWGRPPSRNAYTTSGLGPHFEALNTAWDRARKLVKGGAA